MLADFLGDMGKTIVPRTGIDVHREVRVAMSQEGLGLLHRGAAIRCKGGVRSPAGMKVNFALRRPLWDASGLQVLVQLPGGMGWHVQEGVVRNL